MREFTFDGQRADESVEEVIRNHPFVLFWPGFKCVLILAVPVAALIYLGASTIFAISAFLALLIDFSIFGRVWYEFSASVFLITNQRIMYLDQVGFFKRKIIETNLDKIQDVSSDTSGMIRTSLDFGDVMIRTAGASAGSEIIIKNIAHPYQVQQAISKRIH